MVIRKVANPTPGVLAFVNPRRKNKMATRKRKSSTKRRVHRAAAAPAKRRRSANPRRHAALARATHHRRRRNPTVHGRRRHVRRHRNPLGGGLLKEAGSFAVASVGLGFAAPIVTRFVGGFLPFGQFNQPVITAGTGWLLSKAFNLLSFTKPFARPALIVGISAAIVQAVSPYVRQFLGGAAPVNPLGMSGPGMYQRRGMRGIAAVPSFLPTGLAAPVPAPATSGMHGIAAVPVPGRFR